VVVELGDDLAGHQVGDRRGELRPLLALEQLEQIGDVRRVERLDQFVGARLVACSSASATESTKLGLSRLSSSSSSSSSRERPVPAR
jgi:hypothetical protein